MHHPTRHGDTPLETRHDPGLPQLARALEAATLAARLGPLGEHGALRVRILKHVVGKRAVLALEFEDGARVIAKLYRKARAARHADVLAELGAALQSSHTRVPRLVACWNDLGLVVQEWVPGSSVPDYADLSGESALVERLGTALAELHEAPATCGPRADLAAHVRRTCGVGLESLGAEWPQMAAIAHELEGVIYAREAKMARNVRPCHGDFSPRQLFVQAPYVHLVDLDGLSQGDPAFDVASFRVGLEAHLGDAGRALGDRFLAAYLERRGVDALPTLRHHEAFCDLRRALICWRKRPADWESTMRTSLERGRARL